MPDNDPIQGAEQGVPESGTPAPVSGVEKQSTPAQNPPPVDVEKLRAEYEQKLVGYQNDLNQMKSSLQRREAQVTAEWQERYNKLQRQMHETRMSSMTDEQRAKYERQLESEEMQNLQEQLITLQSERQTMAQTMEAMNFFLQKGVPATTLDISGGYDALVRSGWAYIDNELTQLRQAASNPQPKSNEPAPLKPAPGVITDKATPASNGTTWKALREQYGSEEAVYRAVEEGRAPADIIPG